MTNQLYIAMTAGEISACQVLPENIGWMACHFAPDGDGLTDLPDEPVAGSILIVNDRFPIVSHREETVFNTLSEYIQAVPCRGILLDFQRPGNQRTASIVKALQSLPCPVCVSECYAGQTLGPVFVHAPYPHQPLQSLLVPWDKREIWLEVSIGAEICVLTENGCEIIPAPEINPNTPVHEDPALCCHYCIRTDHERAEFHLYRTKEDISALVQMGRQFGVTMGIGLWQELYMML